MDREIEVDRHVAQPPWLISITSCGRPHSKMRREGRESLPDHAGESTLLSRSGGEKGLRGNGAGTLGVPLGGTRRVGGLLGVAGRLSGTISPFRAKQGTSLETPWRARASSCNRWEPRGFSRVAAGFLRYDGDLSLPYGLALGSPIFPSGCEAKLGVALGSVQGRRDLT